mgnify:CR=1 FL=1
MTWFAIVNDTDGELISVGDVVAGDATLAAAGYVKVPIADNPGSDLWDKVTRTFSPRPLPPALVDRIEEIVNDIGLSGVLNTTPRKNVARTVLAKYLPGRVRFHPPSDLEG